MHGLIVAYIDLYNTLISSIRHNAWQIIHERAGGSGKKSPPERSSGYGDHVGESSHCSKRVGCWKQRSSNFVTCTRLSSVDGWPDVRPGAHTICGRVWQRPGVPFHPIIAGMGRQCHPHPTAGLLARQPGKDREWECVSAADAACTAVLSSPDPAAKFCSLQRDQWRWTRRSAAIVSQFDLVCAGACMGMSSLPCDFAAAMCPAYASKGMR